MVEDGGLGFEDAVGEPVLAHELADVLLGIELGALGRQEDDGDFGRDDEGRSAMPAGLIDQKHRVAPGSTWREISARCSVIASVLQRGMTSPGALPSQGQIAPKI